MHSYNIQVAIVPSQYARDLSMERTGDLFAGMLHQANPQAERSDPFVVKALSKAAAWQKVRDALKGAAQVYLMPGWAYRTTVVLVGLKESAWEARHEGEVATIDALVDRIRVVP